MKQQKVVSFDDGGHGASLRGGSGFQSVYPEQAKQGETEKGTDAWGVRGWKISRGQGRRERVESSNSFGREREWKARIWKQKGNMEGSGVKVVTTERGKGRECWGVVEGVQLEVRGKVQGEDESIMRSSKQHTHRHTPGKGQL